MKTQVCITVDIEFDINGTFGDPDRRKPAGPETVRCSINGQDEGLGFILRTLRQHGLTGVFFVEALNTCYFGDAPMGEIARDIQADGHDVELHLHPAWAYFANPDWRDELERNPPNDWMALRTPQEIRHFIDLGLQAFRNWSLPPPIAVRAGSLTIDRSIYGVMREMGLPLSSHLGMGLFRPAEAALHLNGGRHRIDDVTEVPVTSYRDLRLGSYAHWKLLTIQGVSSGEMRYVLNRAASSIVGPMVILTHAHEYARCTDNGSTFSMDPLSRKRLELLCRFLADNPERFEVTTFRAQRDAWVRSPNTMNPVFTVPPWSMLRRLIQNRLGVG